MKKIIQNKFICALFFESLIYVIVFLIVPNIIMVESRFQERNQYLFLFVVIIISSLGVLLVSDKIWHWAVTTPILWLLVNLYHPKYVYGIGYKDPIFNSGLDETFGFIIFVFIIFVVQIIIIGIKKAFLIIRNKYDK